MLSVSGGSVSFQVIGMVKVLRVVVSLSSCCGNVVVIGLRPGQSCSVVVEVLLRICGDGAVG